MISNEVPIHDDHVDPPTTDAMTRRTAMKMFSLSALVAMASGCIRKPERRIVALHDRPEYQQPGMPLYYASTWLEGEHPYGMLVKQIDGRPIKIEGLEGHPLNPTGTSTGQMQASLYNLYDPERLRSPMIGGKEATWAEADKAVVAALQGARRVLVVSRPTLGPSERDLLGRFRRAVPGAQHLTYAPAQDRYRRQAWQEIYGAAGEITTKLENARVVLSIDSDFLGTDGDVLTNARGFAQTRVPGAANFSRLYVAEGGMTATGSSADHRIPMRPSAATDLARGLLSALGGDSSALNAAAGKHGWDAKVLGALVKDLDANKGKAAVLAGPHVPAAVHGAVAQINARLGASGATLGWNATPAASIASDPSDLRTALGAGPDVAIFLGVNPAFDMPGGLGDVLGGVKTTIAHGLTLDETLAQATIALPSAHALECWNDAVVTDGVTGIAQPMIAPLFDGRSEADSLLAWTKATGGGAGLGDVKDFHGFVQQRFGLDREAWDALLRQGYQGTPKNAALPAPRDVEIPALAVPGAGTMDVVLAPHPITGDGRFGGNAWLLETPEPCHKVCWDNVAAMAPATARALGVEEGDWVAIEANGATVKLPALPQPGVQADTIVAHVGFGRTTGGGHANGVGVNVAPLGAGLVRGTVSKAGGDNYPLAKTQHVFDQDYSPTGTPMKRHIAIGGTPKAYAHHQEHPAKAPDGSALTFPDRQKHKLKLDQIDPEVDYSKGHKWGLSIDLNKCTGCHACLLACQSENNIVVVGKEEVAKGRDMSWIRIDRYEAGPEENPEILLQPMLCQHCDNAPCETVCPVNATAHSPEGLNDQIYNRCVGTRYCANNCPYKVRRFNFFNYTGDQTTDPVQELRANPHVTVRTRGVMEKCTFCVQRINAAKFEAANAHEAVEDGAVVTACQQACPSDAIVFGDANVEGGLIETARGGDLAYHVLEEINTRPNVTYAARIRNVHPDLDDWTPPKDHGHAGGHEKGGH